MSNTPSSVDLLGHGNTAFGYQALQSNTTGIGATAFGYQALQSDTDCGGVTAFGYQALQHNSEGCVNTALGSRALSSNTTGFLNTATGADALSSNTTGGYNLAEGYQALVGNTTGNYNTALGWGTLAAQTAGVGNTALGWGAGASLKTGNQNIYLGHPGAASESNTLRLGSNLQKRTFVAGISNTPIIGNTVLINSAGQLGMLVSSARYKRDIQAMGKQSQKLEQLRPITFHYKQEPKGPVQYGLIAEEVAKVYPELVTKGVDGKIESVQYHELIPLLLNEVQHQQQELAQLKAQNAWLRAAVVALQEQKPQTVQNTSVHSTP